VYLVLQSFKRIREINHKIHEIKNEVKDMQDILEDWIIFLNIAKGDYILTKSEIEKRLKNIYLKIPDFECKHCHKCCGPIIWFKPEEIFIRDYLKIHDIDYIVWSTDQFKNNDMRCPYIENDGCVIYPVRPIVCRLQGNVSEMPCKYNAKDGMSKELIDEIKKEFEKLLEETDGKNIFYSTKKYNIEFWLLPNSIWKDISFYRKKEKLDLHNTTQKINCCSSISGGGGKLDQKKMIERWMKQIKAGEINPEALGLGSDKEKALEKLKDQIAKINYAAKRGPGK
jgi:Fe-S-cluster containining protein